MKVTPTLFGAENPAFRHGHVVNGRRSREQQSYTMMKQRCTNPRRPEWPYYGGRGIRVCDRWLHSFGNFLEDMGPRPQNATLDRKNRDGNYEPSNCRWATKKQQASNRRQRVDLKEHVAAMIAARRG